MKKNKNEEKKMLQDLKDKKKIDFFYSQKGCLKQQQQS